MVGLLIVWVIFLIKLISIFFCLTFGLFLFSLSWVGLFPFFVMYINYYKLGLIFLLLLIIG